MSPDDERHGSHAGAIQHWRNNETPCPKCATAARRHRKARELETMNGRPATVPLGAAWDVIDQTPLNQLRIATGIRTHRLIEYRNRGPEMVVRRATRDRLLAVGGRWTVLGIQRRLQALTALGWSMRIIAEEAGVGVEAVKRIRREDDRMFVRARVAEAVVSTYERLSMTPAPEGPSRTRTLVDARRNGYVSHLAWDDIDRDEAPTGIYAKPTNQSEWMVEHTAKRAADLEHAVDLGRTLEQAADDLSLSAEAVEVWCKRRGRTDLLEALRKRSREREMGSAA